MQLAQNPIFHQALMPMQQKMNRPAIKIYHRWKLSTAATLGSALRARGILLEVRAHLPAAAKKLVDVEAGSLVLLVPESSEENYRSVVDIVSGTLAGVERLPVIPREVEDILSISSAERHRWLKDGRLRSVGTRTVKLRGRARKITFHVFDPQQIEDALNRNLAEVWREQDAQTAAENRRRAAGKAALARAGKNLKATSKRACPAGSNSQRERSETLNVFDPGGLLR